MKLKKRILNVLKNVYFLNILKGIKSIYVQTNLVNLTLLQETPDGGVKRKKHTYIQPATTP